MRTPNLKAGQPAVFASKDDSHDFAIGAGDMLVLATRSHVVTIELVPAVWSIRCPASIGDDYPVLGLVLPSICAQLLAQMQSAAEIFGAFEEAGLLPHTLH